MRDVIVLGCGRSGTSTATGVLARAGYFMGGRLARANGSNPKGFFEAVEVNRINEEILTPLTPWRPPILRHVLYRSQRWLARVPVDARISDVDLDAELEARIRKLVDHQPYCFKDPRFSYTLDAWRPFLRNPLYLCIFRDPAATVESILKECRKRIYLWALPMDRDRALDVWRLMYLHIVRRFRHEGDWLFLHYEQLLRGDGVERLAQRTGASVDTSFPERSLHRTRGAGPVPPDIDDLYGELCALAGYAPAAPPAPASPSSPPGSFA